MAGLPTLGLPHGALKKRTSHVLIKRTCRVSTTSSCAKLAPEARFVCPGRFYGARHALAQPVRAGERSHPKPSFGIKTRPSPVLRNLQQPQFHSDTFRIWAAAGPFPTLASSSGGDDKASGFRLWLLSSDAFR